MVACACVALRAERVGGQTGVRPGSEPGQTGVRPGSDHGSGPSHAHRTLARQTRAWTKVDRAGGSYRQYEFEYLAVWSGRGHSRPVILRKQESTCSLFRMRRAAILEGGGGGGRERRAGGAGRGWPEGRHLRRGARPPPDSPSPNRPARESCWRVPRLGRDARLLQTAVSMFAIRQFKLPVKNGYLPGSGASSPSSAAHCWNVDVTTSHRVMAGALPPRAAAGVFTTAVLSSKPLTAFKGTVLAKYPAKETPRGQDVLRASRRNQGKAGRGARSGVRRRGGSCCLASSRSGAVSRSAPSA
jgi:hypothetical protein